MTTTADIITTTTNDETTTKANLAKSIRYSLERINEMRELCDDPSNGYLSESLWHILRMLEAECDDKIRNAVYLTLTQDFDAISDIAVTETRQGYLDGRFAKPADDMAVAFDYATALLRFVDTDERDHYFLDPEGADDKFEAIRAAYFNAIYADGFEDEMIAADEMFEEALDDLRSLFCETSGSDLARKVAEAELVDDVDENLDDLLSIGHLTVDDLLRRLPEDKGDKISLASALVTGGLVCDPNGRVYLEAFEPTAGTSNYPSRVADAIVDNRMTILTNAFEILDLAADHRTVQLTRDLFATILSFNEVPEDIWVPYVHNWQDNPSDARWARHERRWAAIMSAYDQLHDEYVATHGNPAGDDSEDEAPAEPALDEYIIATGGWLLVEDETTEDKWYVNALDVFGFDDARNVYDAGETWARPYYALRQHGMTAA